jgi:hypothetical protein
VGRVLVGLLVFVTLILSSACWSGDSSPSATAGPSPTDDDVRATLAKARDALADATSMQIALTMQRTFGEDSSDFSADLTYVAPSSLFGTVTVPDGSFAIQSEDNRVFAGNGGSEWIEPYQVFPLAGMRQYGGGAVDIGGLAKNLTNLKLDERDRHVEKIRGSLPSLAFMSWAEQVVERGTFVGVVFYSADSAEIWLERKSGLPTMVQVDGDAKSVGSSGTFSMRMEFSHYDKVFDVPPTPIDVTPYIPTEIADTLTPTPVLAVGCAAGISLSPASDDIGRVYHSGETLSVTINYTAPGCRDASASFDGEYVADSPRYRQVCRHQCGDSIPWSFDSEQFPLDGPTGTVTIKAALQRLFATPEANQVDPLEGFRLCRVTVTFNDGVIGGTTYKSVMGSPETRFPPKSACSP